MYIITIAVAGIITTTASVSMYVSAEDPRDRRVPRVQPVLRANADPWALPVRPVRPAIPALWVRLVRGAL
ncbi:hypothetical protein FACS1894120_2850 [Clostridia bacterium]|nr:hypothetical protein FACS1894120_2850 [Clostridia bacterium]